MSKWLLENMDQDSQNRLGLVGAAKGQNWDYSSETWLQWAHRKELQKYDLHRPLHKIKNAKLAEAMK